jgi:hypothetical protein
MTTYTGSRQCFDLAANLADNTCTFVPRDPVPKFGQKSLLESSMGKLVQEMLLTRKVYFLSQDTMIPLQKLKRLAKNLEIKLDPLQLTGLLNTTNTFSDKSIKLYSLIHNVEHFRHK